MLTVIYGLSAMIPIIFGVAGYLLVSRDPARLPASHSGLQSNLKRTDNHD